MKILLDTNILIHRESNRIINNDIGVLFGWLDKLHYQKLIHPLSLREISKYQNRQVVETIQAKLKNYVLLNTESPENQQIQLIRQSFDKNENDFIDTSLLKEVFNARVDFLITEDRAIHAKALSLGINQRVFSIDSFLEKVTSENPGLVDYKTLAVKKEFFGDINLADSFFDSFREDYDGFDRWFNSKSEQVAYVCKSEKNEILAFLYVKVEGESENYCDVEPIFPRKKRLKIGTFKVISNGFKLGERFLKILFDNAIINHVDEVYVTLFNKTEEHERLIGLLTDWGFLHWGKKSTKTGDELVYIKNFKPIPDIGYPKSTYPFVDRNRRFFIVPIYPQYHTELFPDSILNNESPSNFIENEPHRNAIQKVYISRSFYKDLLPGDLIVFYRTKTPGSNAFYSSVVTTIGIVESVHKNIRSLADFIALCRKRSVFTDEQLATHWNYSPSKPFVVNFLYVYTFPKRPILKELIEMGVISGVNAVPRGFTEITADSFNSILKASKANESFIVD